MDMLSIVIYAWAMITPTVPPGKRATTRARICAVAGDLFFDRGFAGVTMEEIAKAADIQRSTLYLHFRDKDEILSAIAGDYTAKLLPVVARLPGPAPTRAQIADWVREMADFVMREPAATELLVSLSHLPKAPAAALAFGGALQQMMAGRLAAFRHALEPGQTMAYAWSVATMDSLGWALCHHARTGGNAVSEARLAVAAEQLSSFVGGHIG
jgi:AcrR family transcriptional regulator